MLVLFIVCLMKLLEMYTNNNKMARRSARNAKENCFGLQDMTQKFGMPDESLAKQQDGDRYSMNYFYDVDQSCVEQLKEFLHQQSGNNCSSCRGSCCWWRFTRNYTLALPVRQPNLSFSRRDLGDFISQFWNLIDAACICQAPRSI